MARPKSDDPTRAVSIRLKGSVYEKFEKAGEEQGITAARAIQMHLERGTGFKFEIDTTREGDPPVDFADLLMREPEASAALSEESPFKTCVPKPKPKIEPVVDLMEALEKSLADAKANKPLARKTVTPNFKKDKK